jgi:hypothetical protein
MLGLCILMVQVKGKLVLVLNQARLDEEFSESGDLRSVNLGTRRR